MPKVKFLKGWVSKQELMDHCKDNEIPEKKVIFVFPSGEHLGHHTGKNFDARVKQVKRGKGLAQLAEQWGESGNPTLGLPTVFTDNNADNKVIIDQSLADLWQAVGAGYDLVFPVREITEENKGYFGEASEISIQGDNKQYHLSWYGGIEKIGNQALADRYAMHVQVISAFVIFEKDYRKNNLSAKSTELLEAFKKDLELKNKALADKFQKEWTSAKTAYLEANNKKDSGSSKKIIELVEIDKKSGKPLKANDVIQQLTKDTAYTKKSSEPLAEEKGSIYTVEHTATKAKIFVHADEEGHVNKIGVELPDDDNAKKIIELITNNPDVAFRVSDDSKNDNLRKLLEKASVEKQIVFKNGLYTSANGVNKKKDNKKTNEKNKENNTTIKLNPNSKGIIKPNSDALSKTLSNQEQKKQKENNISDL